MGFLQIDQAFNYYQKYHKLIDTNVHFAVKVSSSGDRGIYLRGWDETSRIFQSNVNVSVVFREDDVKENPLKLAYEQRLALTCSETWVSVADYLLLNSGGEFSSILSKQSLYIKQVAILMFELIRPACRLVSILLKFKRLIRAMLKRGPFLQSRSPSSSLKILVTRLNSQPTSTRVSFSAGLSVCLKVLNGLVCFFVYRCMCSDDLFFHRINYLGSRRIKPKPFGGAFVADGTSLTSHGI